MVRPALAQDAPAIQHVIRTVYEEYGWPWDPEDYHRDLMEFEANYLTDHSDFFVAVVDGQTVGAGGLVVHPTVPGPRATVVRHQDQDRIAGTDCEIVRLYLLAESRGKGLGKQLNNAILQAAKSRGCRAMEIWSDKRLHTAHRLYQSIGAVQVGERICDDPDESPEWGFFMDLTSPVPQS